MNVVAPISSDKILQQNSGRPNVGNDTKESAKSDKPEATASQPSSTPASSDTVNVSNGARVVNHGVESSQDAAPQIENADQALAMVQRLREQISGGGAEALQAQGGLSSGQINSLLSSAPA